MDIWGEVVNSLVILTNGNSHSGSRNLWDQQQRPAQSRPKESIVSGKTPAAADSGKGKREVDQGSNTSTSELLNSVVNVDDVVQKIGSHLRSTSTSELYGHCRRYRAEIGSHLRLRFERFDYDSYRVAICEGCNSCKADINCEEEHV